MKKIDFLASCLLVCLFFLFIRLGPEAEKIYILWLFAIPIFVLVTFLTLRQMKAHARSRRLSLVVAYGGFLLLSTVVVNDLFLRPSDALKSIGILSLVGALLIVRNSLSKVNTSEDVMKPGRSLFRAYRVVDMVAALTVLISISSVVFWHYGFGQTDSHILIAIAAAVLLSSVPELFAVSRTMPMRSILQANSQATTPDNALAFEVVAQSECVVLAGIGVCVQGEPQVSGIAVNEHGPYNEKQILQLAASAELTIEDPLARAVVGRAKQRGLTLKKPSRSEYIIGKGISAEVFDTLVHVGNERFMDELLVRISHIRHKTAEQEHHGKTVLYVAVDHECIGAIFLENEIGPEQAASLKRAVGNRRTVLLSGDNKETVKQIAAKLKISEYFSGAGEIERDEILARLGQKYVTTVVVKQPVPYPAARHAQAIIHIGAISKTYTKPAVVLSGGALDDVEKIFKLATILESSIRLNMLWATIYNVVSLSLAFGLSVLALNFFWGPLSAVFAAAAASLFPHVISIWLKRSSKNIIITNT